MNIIIENNTSNDSNLIITDNNNCWSYFYVQYICKAMYEKMRKIIKLSPRKRKYDKFLNDYLCTLHYKYIQEIKKYLFDVDTLLTQHLYYISKIYKIYNLDYLNDNKNILINEKDIENYNFDEINYENFYIINEKNINQKNNIYFQINIKNLHISLLHKYSQNDDFINALTYFELSSFYMLIFYNKLTYNDSTIIYQNKDLFNSSLLMNFYTKYMTLYDISFEFINGDDLFIQLLNLHDKFQNMLKYSIENKQNIILQSICYS